MNEKTGGYLFRKEGVQDKKARQERNHFSNQEEKVKNFQHFHSIAELVQELQLMKAKV